VNGDIMKKITSIVLLLALCLSFFACSSKTKTENTTEAETESSTLAAESNADTASATKEVATTVLQVEATQPVTEEKTTQGTTAHVHKWNKADCLTPKTCRTCGATEGTTGSHSYSDATCTSPAKCSVCNQTNGEPLGCTAGADNTCIRCGKTMLTLESVLSAPIDSLAELNTFVHGYFTQQCYLKGNFRLIFDTADGVYFSWGARNISDKEIESITYTINYYTKSGAPAYDEITGQSSFTGAIIGPIGPGKAFYSRYIIGYGRDIHYGRVTDVTVLFTDGTSVSGNYGYTTWHNIRTEDSPNKCMVIEK
jgi:hypothetical protein